MAELVIALGSNQGDRHKHLCDALVELPPKINVREVSAIYVSEPVGPSQQNFLNAVCIAESKLDPTEILNYLKQIEKHHGRDLNAPRWSARPLDLDIITYNSLVIQMDTLIIPHSAYRQRLFVLLPLRDLCPNWTDPKTGESIDWMINQAPDMHIRRTPLTWQKSD